MGEAAHLKSLILQEDFAIASQVKMNCLYPGV